MVEECKDEKRALFTKVKKLPDEEVADLIDYHFNDCEYNDE
jgi:hypothetical protein